MFRTKAVAFALIATFLVGGLPAQADTGRAAGQGALTGARAEAAKTTGSQSYAKSRETKPAQSCTYRGGPKTGFWDCR